MLSSPISTPSPRQKADAEKKQREVEEAERRKIYAENICSKEEKPGYGGGKIYSEKERMKFSEEERGREGEEEGGESEEEEEVATRYKEAASCQDVAQVF